MKILVLGKGVANDGVIELLQEENVEYDYLEINEVDSFDYSYVVKAPGIPYTAEVILEFIKRRIRVLTDIELGMSLRKKLYIGVTGSNGKTTTVSLLQHILSAQYSVVACGNIGYSFCRALVEQRDAEIFIIEMSSFQLENSKIDPDISLFLNVHPCHLDHHQTFKDYVLSKANICINQSENHLFIYPSDDAIIQSIVKQVQARTSSFSRNNPLADCYISSHQIFYKNHRIVKLSSSMEEKAFFVEDMMAAISASIQFKGITPRIIQKQMKTFQEVEYRLTKLNDFIYNDAKSTNPYSTIAALCCFSSVELICGGYDRKEDLFCLKDSLSKLKRVYAYGQSKEKIKKFMDENHVECFIFDSLDEAFYQAFKDRKDEIILFSPMFASFDLFKNYIERGAYFNKIVMNLLKSK